MQQVITNHHFQLAGLKRDFDTMWTEADEDTRRTYGRAYLDSQYQSVVDSAATAAKTILPVVDAMEAAVSAVNPQYRYLVDGSNSLIDYNNVSRLVFSYPIVNGKGIMSVQSLLLRSCIDYFLFNILITSDSNLNLS